MLSWSIVWLLFIIYAWLIISVIFQNYLFKHFLYLLCFSGIWVSLTWLFIKGIEEVPLPKGAFLFKVEGVVPSIILFMLFTIPLIVYHFGFERQRPPQKLITKSSATKKKSGKNNDWEEASIEDVESGNFEII
tara:strand:+ start:326 stop:724 length:399 start_codon:yes stop_codon:yes gene_type:complete